MLRALLNRIMRRTPTPELKHSLFSYYMSQQNSHLSAWQVKPLDSLDLIKSTRKPLRWIRKYVDTSH